MISDYCKQSIPFLGWTVFSQWNGFKKRNSQFFFWHALIINEVSEVVLFQSQFQLFSINVRIDGWINPYYDVVGKVNIFLIQVRFWHSNLTKTRTSASTLETRIGASKIQDGEDVNFLRSPEHRYNTICWMKRMKQKLETYFIWSRTELFSVILEQWR